MSRINWLKKARTNAYLTQEQLAEKARISVDQIKYWESSGKKSKQKALEERDYKNLASAVDSTADHLKIEHKQDRIHHSSLQEAEQTEVDERQIEDALDACVDQDFQSALQSLLQVDDNRAASTRVGEILRKKDAAGLFDAFNPPLYGALNRCEQLAPYNWEDLQKRLESLRQVIVVVGVNAMIPLGNLSVNGEFVVHGSGRAWAIRLRLDRTLGHVFTETRALNAARLDDQATRSLISSGEASNLSAAGELQTVIKTFVERYPEVENMLGLPPDPQRDLGAFEEYCVEFNNTLEQDNRLPNHAFVLLLQQCSDELPAMVQKFLKDIRLFRHNGPGLGDFPALIDESKLEKWLAKWLYCIDTLTESMGELRDEQTHEEKVMSKEPQVTINNLINTGNGASQTVAGRDAHSAVNDLKAVSDILAQIIDVTDPNDADQLALRGAVHELQNSITGGKGIPEKGASWIEKATRKVKVGENITGLLIRLQALLGKIDGIGG